MDATTAAKYIDQIAAAGHDGNLAKATRIMDALQVEIHPTGEPMTEEDVEAAERQLHNLVNVMVAATGIHEDALFDLL